jgi:hypothetical protein
MRVAGPNTDYSLSLSDKLSADTGTYIHHQYKLGLLASFSMSNQTLLTHRHMKLSFKVPRYNDTSKYRPALLHDVFIWLRRHASSIHNFIRDAGLNFDDAMVWLHRISRL